MHQLRTRRRIALYSHDTQGLGHVRRNIAIGAALVAAEPRTDVLVLTGAPEATVLPLPPSTEVLTLAARLRLAAVYAFRPAGTAAAAALLADGLQAGGDGPGRGANALAERFDVDVGDEDHRDGAVARPSRVHHR